MHARGEYPPDVLRAQLRAQQRRHRAAALEYTTGEDRTQLAELAGWLAAASSLLDALGASPAKPARLACASLLVSLTERADAVLRELERQRQAGLPHLLAELAASRKAHPNNDPPPRAGK